MFPTIDTDRAAATLKKRIAAVVVLSSNLLTGNLTSLPAAR
jgi:hypothetical protein